MKKEKSKKIGGLQQVVAQLPTLMSPVSVFGLSYKY
jgi:hypothetical protein